MFPFNGALMLVPKSHTAARSMPATISRRLRIRCGRSTKRPSRGSAASAEEDGKPGIVAPAGKPGSVLMFHGNLVHGSAPNITPYPRKIIYLTLCAVSNHITKFTRPEFIAHRDFTPIEPVDDDALLEHARAHRVAAE